MFLSAQAKPLRYALRWGWFCSSALPNLIKWGQTVQGSIQMQKYSHVSRTLFEFLLVILMSCQGQFATSNLAQISAGNNTILIPLAPVSKAHVILGENTGYLQWSSFYGRYWNTTPRQPWTECSTETGATGQQAGAEVALWGEPESKGHKQVMQMLRKCPSNTSSPGTQGAELQCQEWTHMLPREAEKELHLQGQPHRAWLLNQDPDRCVLGYRKSVCTRVLTSMGSQDLWVNAELF